MDVVIPDEMLQAAHVSPEELLREVAIMLFTKEKLTLARASRLAGMRRQQFQHLLSSRGIPVHYDVTDFEQDLATLDGLGRT